MASQLWTLQRSALRHQLEVERCGRQLKALVDLPHRPPACG